MKREVRQGDKRREMETTAHFVTIVGDCSGSPHAEMWCGQ